jgi:bifunctional DNA primase/polymerase-like protein/primase-like protein
MLNSNIVDQALAIAARGHKVFPLHGVVDRSGRLVCTCGRRDCGKYTGKHTFYGLAPHSHLDATTDVCTIKSWWEHRPWLNYGINAENLVILDVDLRHDGDRSLADLEAKHEPLPHTWHCLTGDGEHVYFSKPEGALLKCNAGALGPGFDLRTRGGYVVGAGSRHLSGRYYAWSVDHHPDETPLAALPKWLLTAAATPIDANGRPAPKGNEHWRALTSRKLLDGERDNQLTSVFGHLLAKGVDPIVAAMLADMNQVRCTPPKTEQELWRIINSICAKEFNKRGF